MNKDFIDQNLLTSNGGLNNRVCILTWWDNKNFLAKLNDLYNITDFLPSEATISERLYCVYKDIKYRSLCYCGNFANFNSFKLGYYTYCSAYCATQHPDRNKKISEKLDYIKIHEKVRKTNLEKYGVGCSFQRDSVIKKSDKTKEDRYGNKFYTNPLKSIETCLEKYGVKYSCQSGEVKNKIEETKTKNNPFLRDIEWLKNENKTKSINQIAIDLGVTYRTVYLRYQKYNIDMNFFAPDYSKQQSEMMDYVKSITDSDILINDRNIIKPKELDIYLPEFKIAIEYNGMYWHSNNNKRHKEKYDLCKSVGIRLFQFWDMEWITKNKIVKSIIKNALGMSEKIYGRKCEIRSLDVSTYRNFLEDNHIQGYVASKIKYGLYYENELYSVIGFGKSRFDKKCSHELLRFCNKLNYSVLGGFSKLLKYTLKNHPEIIKLQTFCDKRIFSGGSYLKSDFKFSHTSSPGYVYYKSGFLSLSYEDKLS